MIGGRTIGVALALVLTLPGCERPPPKPPAYKVGDRLEAHALPGLDGAQVELASFRGKVVLINFWASWCPPCMAEVPQLEKELWQAYKDKGLQVLGVNREEDAATARACAEKKGITYPVLLDQERALYSRFGARVIPYNVVLDREGRVLYAAGDFQLEVLRKVIDAELAKR